MHTTTEIKTPSNYVATILTFLFNRAFFTGMDSKSEKEENSTNGITFLKCFVLGITLKDKSRKKYRQLSYYEIKDKR